MRRTPAYIGRPTRRDPRGGIRRLGPAYTTWPTFISPKEKKPGVPSERRAPFNAIDLTIGSRLRYPLCGGSLGAHHSPQFAQCIRLDLPDTLR